MALFGLDFNLLEQLAFYGSYHSNVWNQLIHFFFIPLILWSVLVWMAYAGPILPLPTFLRSLPPPLSTAITPNLALIATTIYSLYYLALDPVAGLTWALLIGAPLWISSTLFQVQVEAAWLYALGAFVLGWYMQIHPGHAVLEKRRPALMDSIAQAFALGPLFVWFDALFLLGYRPQLRKELAARTDVLLAEHRAKKGD